MMYELIEENPYQLLERSTLSNTLELAQNSQHTRCSECTSQQVDITPDLENIKSRIIYSDRSELLDRLQNLVTYKKMSKIIF